MHFEISVKTVSCSSSTSLTLITPPSLPNIWANTTRVYGYWILFHLESLRCISSLSIFFFSLATYLANGFDTCQSPQQVSVRGTLVICDHITLKLSKKNQYLSSFYFPFRSRNKYLFKSYLTFYHKVSFVFI